MVRHRVIKDGNSIGPVVYWMSRDHRAHDNWALLHAQAAAKEQGTHIEVVFCLRPNLRPHFGTRRMLDFLLGGLASVHAELAQLHIPFFLLIGDPVEVLPDFLHQRQAGTIVCDTNPLRWHRRWLDQLARTLPNAVHQVDAHNVVPVWLASPKQEWSAATFRPKLHRQLSSYLVPFPHLHAQAYSGDLPGFSQQSISHKISVDESVTLPPFWHPGSESAKKQMHSFITHKLSAYAAHRNDPTRAALSDLSPYLHFGQLSAQSVALAIQQHGGPGSDTYLEELLVRRELAENYCWHNADYDNPNGFPDWAKKTLAHHAGDKREHHYSLDALATAQTHDPAWNAAQTQLITTGKLHGYMRMYWAKQIALWTPNIATAQKYAIYLNDKYELDGRDPNGYTGIAWSLGGVHDRPWFDRPIIGTLRPMTTSGLAKKFPLTAYISQYVV